MLFALLRSSAIPISPNCRSRSTSATVAFPLRRASATARFVAIVVQPTPPFGLYTAMTAPGRAVERGSLGRDDLRLGLQHKDADWADRIHHRAIPNDCTRYVMSTLRVVTSCVSARERTARSIVA